MPSQIRPTRMEVSDRFPMLGFSIRTDDGSNGYEVALASDPNLFRPEAKAKRTRDTFFASTASGPLPAGRSETVYVVPPEVLARFVGHDRVYYALAIHGSGDPSGVTVNIPSAASPYVNLKGLSGRSLQRVRLIPSRERGTNGYQRGSLGDLEWGGDRVQPGSEPVFAARPPEAKVDRVITPTSPNGAAVPSATATALEYNDGFGPLPPEPSRISNPSGEDAATPPTLADKLDIDALVKALIAQGAHERELWQLVDKVRGSSPRLAKQDEGVATPAPTQQSVSMGLGLLPIPLDDAKPAKLPSAREATGLESTAIEAALALIPAPLSTLITTLRSTLITLGDVSVAIGPAASVGFLLGAGIGAGVIFTSDGKTGIYGKLEISAGILDSASIGLQVTIVRGGIKEFNEVGFTVGGSFIEGVALTLQVLLGGDKIFRGISFTFGVGAAVEPFELFASVEGSIAGALSVEQALRPVSKSRLRSALSKELALAPIPVNEAQPVTSVSAKEASTLESPIVEAALALIPEPFASVINSVRSALDSYGPVSLAIGPAISAGLVLGAGLGAGVIFTSSGKIGIYGNIDLSAGIMKSVSLGLQVTLVRGGIDEFNDIGYAVSGAFVEGVALTLQVLLGADKQFRGISFTIGAGFDPVLIAPLELFGSIEVSVAGTVSDGQALQLQSDKSNRLLLPPPPAPIKRALALGAGVEIATTVIGAAMERIIANDGNITWELDQLRGIKHPNDTAPSPMPAFHDAPTIQLNDWPYVEALDRDQISAWFSVDWQFNGASLGNVRITNIGTNGALLRKLQVSARIMDDNIVYPETAPRFAALRVRFHYRFARAIGSDAIAVRDVHLFGDGTFESSGNWEQF